MFAVHGADEAGKAELVHPAVPFDAAGTLAGDGNFVGACERPDEEVLAMGRIAVEETLALIEVPWA